ncbi:molybdopterin-guanine dinucleotide biosynthesis protein B [Cohnella pontilimi]|uniref:Molybdopterin-guanine dinucleotide biosynthesis protein B n=1 Tax=Cohnella pontilimi TaxID=2564100 RepID=A0A4U0FFA8_9BACL|nr:molybdopterin-guanine dinucleotide biosynthesis protein B [Cohnella pontilimi]TJY43531.1 molybdopterin-guanine dinucleotide biosynthesis protein B [Cohnella pontilimi]
MKVLQVVGYKDAGKTTLVSEIVRELSSRGLLVGTVKHNAHDHEPDIPGTDTWKHREAGAHATAMVSETRTLWRREVSTPLPDLIAAMQSADMNAVIVEGFKQSSYPKLVLLRGDEDVELLKLPGVMAAVMQQSATEAESMAQRAGIPVFRTDNRQFDSILRFVADWCMM